MTAELKNLTKLFAACLAFHAIAASSVIAQNPQSKAAIPDEAAQAAALTLVADVYKPDYAKAKTSEQKIELAKKLLGEGTATKDDLAGRFVLFRVARDIAAQQGDLATAFDAIERISLDFEADRIQMQSDTAATAMKAIKMPKDFQAFTGLLTPVIDNAVAADRYENAKSLAALAVGSARGGNDQNQIKLMTAKAKKIDDIASEFEKVKEAKDILVTKPTDPDANFAVGKFLCFAKGDWRRGGSMLALGSNEDFKALALLELEQAPDSLKLGNRWWKISESLEGLAKIQAQAHAGEWYRKALPGLSGLTKAKVERLLAELPSSDVAAREYGYLEKVNLDNSFDPQKSWTLSFEMMILSFDVPAEQNISTQHWQCPFIWGDISPGKPLIVSMSKGDNKSADATTLSVTWSNGVTDITQAIHHTLTPKDLGKWIKLSVNYNKTANTISVFLDDKLIESKTCQFKIAPIRSIPIHLGGAPWPPPHDNQKFNGKIRSLTFANDTKNDAVPKRIGPANGRFEIMWESTGWGFMLEVTGESEVLLHGDIKKGGERSLWPNPTKMQYKVDTQTSTASVEHPGKLPIFFQWNYRTGAATRIHPTTKATEKGQVRPVRN